MNCIIVDDDETSIDLFKQVAKQIDYLNIIKTCSNPLEAINTINTEDIDVLFLDIEMPEMSGMEMLKALSKRPQVVLTTSHKEYALDAFDLNILDYLVKPVTLPRLLQALTKAKETIHSNGHSAQDYFFIKKNSSLTKVSVRDILWIEALGDYVTIHTRTQRYILHVTLKFVEAKLPANKFVRVHRSYIAHIDNITGVEDTTIYINETSIPIGAIYRENFMKRLNALQ